MSVLSPNPFEALQTERFRAFREEHSSVANLAFDFGEELAYQTPDVLADPSSVQLEVYPLLGGVLAKGALLVSLIEECAQELVDLSMSKAKAGLNITSARRDMNGVMEFDDTARHTLQLLECLRSATGQMPSLAFNKIKGYAPAAGAIFGWQRPHLDSRVLYPTILFADGAGATEICTTTLDAVTRSQVNTAKYMLQCQQNGAVGMMPVGPCDIGVFDGRFRVHRGVGISNKAGACERRSLALNVENTSQNVPIG